MKINRKGRKTNAPVTQRVPVVFLFASFPQRPLTRAAALSVVFTKHNLVF
ncbi:hypothetical protein BH10BAC4_BH10BAC4_23650 [soil metagenome]